MTPPLEPPTLFNYVTNVQMFQIYELCIQLTLQQMCCDYKVHYCKEFRGYAEVSWIR